MQLSSFGAFTAPDHGIRIQSMATCLQKGRQDDCRRGANGLAIPQEDAEEKAGYVLDELDVPGTEAGDTNNGASDHWAPVAKK